MIVLFFVLWLMLAGQVTVRVCLWGAAVSVLMSWFCAKVLERRIWPAAGSWRKLGGVLRYLTGLLAEMLRAGFVVMRLIYTRGRHMEPRLIWFQTPLKSDAARAALANSITLTAGTITVLAEDGRFLVHALDDSLARDIEDCAFQQQLEKMEA